MVRITLYGDGLQAVKQFCDLNSPVVFKLFRNNKYEDFTKVYSDGLSRYYGYMGVQWDDLKIGKEGNDIQVTLCDKVVKKIKVYRRDYK
jgi:hypothetical protein